MDEFWHDYIKPKYSCNKKLCHMDTDSFIMHIKTKYIYEEIANNFEKKFNTSNMGLVDHYPRVKIKK